MSSYMITPKDPEKHKVMVGWDPPMNSFFLHVIDITKQEDDEKRDVLWIGCTPHEIYNPDVVVDKALPYAEIDADMRAQLYKDAYDDKIATEKVETTTDGL